MSKLGADVRVHLIDRIGSGYLSSDIDSQYPSATAIRKALASCGGSVAAEADVLRKSVPVPAAAVMLSALSSGSFKIASLDRFAELAVTVSRSDLSNIRFCGDGLHGYLTNVLSDLRAGDNGLDSLTSKLATKHFTMPRIYRALTMMMLGVDEGSVDNDPRCIRVLGFNHDGRYCLKIMGKCASLPIIHNLSDMLEHPELARSLELSVAAENLAGTFMGVTPGSCWNEPPVR